jgi:hypothetical protein
MTIPTSSNPADENATSVDGFRFAPVYTGLASGQSPADLFGLLIMGQVSVPCADGAGQIPPNDRR